MRKYVAIVLAVFLISAVSAGAEGVGFTCMLSAGEVSPGENVTIFYTVQNDTAGEITGISVTDGAGSYRAGLKKLGPGERFTFKNTIAVYGTLTSSARLVYSDSAGEHTSELMSRAVRASEIAVRVEWTREDCGAAVTAENTGENTITRLVIGKRDGEILRDRLRLEPGEKYSETFPIRDSGEIGFVVTAYDEGGNRHETESVLVFPEKEMRDAILTVSAVPDENVKNGPTRIVVKITNSGGAAENAVLSRETDGEIRVFRVIPEGGTVEWTDEVVVTEDTETFYTIKWETKDGTHESVSGRAAVRAAEGVHGELEAGEKPDNWLLRLFGAGSVYVRMIFWALTVMVVLLIALRLRGLRARRERIRRQEENRYRALLRRRLRKTKKDMT